MPLTLKNVTIEKSPARAVTVTVYPPARNGDAVKETLPSAVNWPEPPDTLTPVGDDVVLTCTGPGKLPAKVTVTVPVRLFPSSTDPRLPPPVTENGACKVPVALNVTNSATGSEIARPASAANSPGITEPVMGIETDCPDRDALLTARTWNVAEGAPGGTGAGFGVTLIIPAGKVPTWSETPPVKFGCR